MRVARGLSTYLGTGPRLARAHQPAHWHGTYVVALARELSRAKKKPKKSWSQTSVKRHAGKTPGKRRENAGLIYSGIIRVDDRDRAIAPYRTVDP